MKLLEKQKAGKKRMKMIGKHYYVLLVVQRLDE
jgi:translation elongation factor EF-4